MLQLQIFERFGPAMAHGATRQSDGDFGEGALRLQENLASLCQANRLAQPPKFLRQVHGRAVVRIDSPQQEAGEGDAMITDQPGVPLAVRTADCQGIIVYEPLRHGLAVIHSGWRGSAQNIIGATLEAMRQEYGCDPAQMRVGIGPSLGPCCAEFTDPARELPEFCRPFIRGRQVDFWGLSRRQCEEAGIPPGQIEVAGLCTRCQEGFFSHRRGETGRSLTWAMLK